MLLKNPKRDAKTLSLKGAVQINHSSFFVYEDTTGWVSDRLDPVCRTVSL